MSIAAKAIEEAKKASEKFSMNQPGIMKEFFAEVAEASAKAAIEVYNEEVIATLQQCRRELRSYAMKQSGPPTYSKGIRMVDELISKLGG